METIARLEVAVERLREQINTRVAALEREVAQLRQEVARQRVGPAIEKRIVPIAK